MFEFDPGKSASNLDKHGINFVSAQELWWDDRRIEAPAHRGAEPRWITIGKIGDKHWTVVFTWRGEAIRLISARRSRASEVAYYEEDHP